MAQMRDLALNLELKLKDLGIDSKEAWKVEEEIEMMWVKEEQMFVIFLCEMEKVQDILVETIFWIQVEQQVHQEGKNLGLCCDIHASGMYLTCLLHHHLNQLVENKMVSHGYMILNTMAYW